ncbi:MAG: hypothetical protein ACREFB_04870, partial [Stellaceae bacterium]
VLGREVDRSAALQAVIERGAGEADDRVVEIVHAHRDAAALEVGDIVYGAERSRRRNLPHPALARMLSI